MTNPLLYLCTIALLTLLALPVNAQMDQNTFNVRDFGAAGDGVADDQPAIARAVRAVVRNEGGVLYFPFGIYPAARQEGMQNGIEFLGASNVTIRFDPGAILLMDNLNPETGLGDRGHAILFRGPGSNITIINATVRWAVKPSGRSHGDAFRFEGYPSDERCLSNIRLLQCSAEASPQTGAVIMGCSDVYVENFRSARTGGDGLHFNACRRVHVTGVTGLENGDDVLAFVTYQDDQEELVDGGTHGPYARPDLGEWNNTNSTASNVYAYGGRANGVRLAGAKHVSLTNVVVEEKGIGIVVDSGKKDATRFGWTYLPSRGISISNLTAVRCNTGFLVWNFNQPTTGEDLWWRFDVQLSNLTAIDCTNDTLHLWDVGGVSVHGVKAENCRIRIRHVKDCSIDGVNLGNAPFIVEGQEDPATVQDAESMGLNIRNISIRNGYADITNCKGLVLSGLQITDPVGEAIRVSNVFSSHLDELTVH